MESLSVAVLFHVVAGRQAVEFLEYRWERCAAEPKPKGNYQTFEWEDLTETMPAHDVVVYASYITGMDSMMTTQCNIRIYSLDGKRLNTLQHGLNIILFDDDTVHKILLK